MTKRLKMLRGAADLREQIVVAKRARQSELPGIAPTVDASRHSDDDVEKFWTLFNEIGVPPGGWQLEPDRLKPPVPPELPLQTAIKRKTKKLKAGRETRGRPWWASMVVLHRDEFLNCGFPFAQPLNDDGAIQHDVILYQCTACRPTTSSAF